MADGVIFKQFEASLRAAGFERFKTALKAVGGDTTYGLRALVKEAEAIMTAAKRLTPVDTGALRASGHVVADKVKARVTLGFGNSAVGYAVIVHENIMASHKTGQAKYLELPLLNAVRGMDARLAASVRADIERVAGKK